jgi:acyltransferase
MKRVISIFYSAYIFEVNYVGAIWFLTCLFSVEIIFFILLKKRLNYLIPVIGLIGAIYPYFTSIRLPFGLDIACTALIFFSLGYFWRYKTNVRGKLLKIWIVFLPINVGFMLMNNKNVPLKFHGRVDMLYMSYGNIIYFYLSAIAGIFFIWGISKYLQNKLIFQMGENSLLIMAFHIWIIELVIQFLLRFVGYNLITPEPDMINIIIRFVPAAGISLILSLWIKKYIPKFIRI